MKINLKRKSKLSDESVQTIFKQKNFEFDEYSTSILRNLLAHDFIDIHHGSEYNKYDLINVLLACNADPNIRNSRNETVSHIVSSDKFNQGHGNTKFAYRTEYVEKLGISGISNKQPVKILDKNYYEGFKKSVSTITNLRNYGVDFEVKDNEGNTPLHNAAKYDYIYNKISIKELLKSRMNVNLQNNNGYTPLHYACLNGNFTAVLELLKSTLNLELKTTNGDTALNIATRNGDYKTCKELINHGSLINTKNNQQNTPLLNSASHPNDKTLKLTLELIKNGAKLNDIDSHGDTLLHKSSLSKSYYTTKTILNKDSLLADKSNNHGDIPLHNAAFNHDYHISKLLLSHTSNPNVKNIDGNTPLHILASKDKINLHKSQCSEKHIANLLLKSGADINARNNDGDTPLHLSAKSGNKEIIQFLIKHGSDRGICNNQGKKPLYYSLERNESKTVNLLIQNKILRDKPLDTYNSF